MNKREIDKAYKLLHGCYTRHEVISNEHGELILSIVYVEDDYVERSKQFDFLWEVREFVNSRIKRNKQGQICATLFKLNDAQQMVGSAAKMMEAAKTDLSVESHLDKLRIIKGELRDAIAKIQEAEKEFVEML